MMTVLQKYTIFLLTMFFLTLFGGEVFATSEEDTVAQSSSSYPIPVQVYEEQEAKMGITESWDKIKFRAQETPFNVLVTGIFVLAVAHTFVASKFTKHAHALEEKLREKNRYLEKEGEAPQSFRISVFHFLGEVEAVFGIWLLPLLVAMSLAYGFDSFKDYADSREFTEPMFVVVIMIIASSKPIVSFAEAIMKMVASLGKSTPAAWWLSVLSIGPILGSFITEPAAMTICAVLLGKRIYDLKPTRKFAYATLGLLFVNISIGGTLTHFAAPPVVMVAKDWGWGLSTMFFDFGWKAVTAIVFSNITYYFVFRKELFELNQRYFAEKARKDSKESDGLSKVKIPIWVTAVSLGFLVWTVMFNHYPVLFIWAFLFFLGFTVASMRYQNAVAIRIPLMVGFFLAALVMHGGLQTWWLQPILADLSSQMAMISSTVLTAFNDNAAITYLAKTVPNLSEGVKHAVVAGAVTGGGLTVIANAPNPAGQSILNKYFPGGVNPLYLFAGAAVPTIFAYLAFVLLYDLI